MELTDFEPSDLESSDINARVRSFVHLPVELQFQTLLDVGYPDMVNLCLASSATRGLCQSDSLWRRLYAKDFQEVPRKTDNAKADYLKTWRDLQWFAKDFVRRRTLVNPRYNNPEFEAAQAADVLERLRTYLRNLSQPAIPSHYQRPQENRTLGDLWRAYANVPLDTEAYLNIEVAESDAEILGESLRNEASSLIPILLGLGDAALDTIKADWYRVVDDIETDLRGIFWTLMGPTGDNDDDGSKTLAE